MVYLTDGAAVKYEAQQVLKLLHNRLAWKRHPRRMLGRLE